jgi:hypothetical protein
MDVFDLLADLALLLGQLFGDILVVPKAGFVDLCFQFCRDLQFGFEIKVTSGSR